MAILNERLFPAARALTVAGEQVVAPPFALVAWAALTRPGARRPPDPDARFPVVIDTAFSHNLYISQGAAQRWAGLRLTRSGGGLWVATDSSGYLLPPIPGDMHIEEVSGTVVVRPRFDADLWLFPNSPRRSIHRLELDGGFALYPTPADPGAPQGPRLPLLGGLALYVNDMTLSVDYKSPYFSLREQY